MKVSHKRNNHLALKKGGLKHLSKLTLGCGFKIAIHWTGIRTYTDQHPRQLDQSKATAVGPE
jgi:hypothetical protein